MIKYRYALNENGQTICADDIAGKVISEKFTCLGCENPLIARVNGEKVRPHFAHKTQVECSGETYLHKLGKATFVDVYTRCLEAGEPFIIQLAATKVCRKFHPAIITNCDLGCVEKEYDLTEYFHNVQVEKRDGQFVPDVLISSKSRPSEKIYIEIAHTHFMSERKESSGNRVIEIPIETEEDINKIRKSSLSASDALFIGFNHATEAITDSECKCAVKKCYAFFVYESGKANLEFNELRAVHSKARKSDRLIYSNLFFSNAGAKSPFENQTEGGRLFIEQVELAANRNVPIKNCYLCRYHAESYDALKGLPIFCKTFKKACGSNEAANCERYRNVV